jgi:SAM-dependent methyltransferase
MNFGDPDFRRIFFEVHSGLPREGPGDEASLRRALSLVGGLPPRPVILDAGCGPGLQTLDLARRTGGVVIGLDNHLPFLKDLSRGIARARLTGRMLAVAGDMGRLPFRRGCFDLIWSEGAAYQMGFTNALLSWKAALKPRGRLAVTEAVWLKPGAPEPVRRCWEEYPDIKDIPAVLDDVASCGFEIAGHFTLPEEAWWTHYYRPMERRLIVLRRKYASDPKSLELLTEHQMEIDVFRKYSDYYGYEFIVCRSKQAP